MFPEIFCFLCVLALDKRDYFTKKVCCKLYVSLSLTSFKIERDVTETIRGLQTDDHQVSGITFKNPMSKFYSSKLTDTHIWHLFKYLVSLADLVLFQVTGPWYLLS